MSLFYLFFFLMIRRPPRSTLDRSSAASDVYKRQTILFGIILPVISYISKDFFDKARPIGMYNIENVHAVPWLENLYNDSFPSGHTMGAFAVSYTHLRAHETVLDIVCRLLLEKKKTTIANIA